MNQSRATCLIWLLPAVGWGLLRQIGHLATKRPYLRNGRWYRHADVGTVAIVFELCGSLFLWRCISTCLVSLTRDTWRSSTFQIEAPLILFKMNVFATCFIGIWWSEVPFCKHEKFVWRNCDVQTYPDPRVKCRNFWPFSLREVTTDLNHLSKTNIITRNYIITYNYS
jgi:hypothetical protein